MGLNGVSKVWIGVSSGGYEVRCASTLKGLSEMIGASYSTMKGKSGRGEKMFTIVVEGMKVWFCVNSEVKKVAGRGKDGFKVEGKRKFEVIR